LDILGREYLSRRAGRGRTLGQIGNVRDDTSVSGYIGPNATNERAGGVLREGRGHLDILGQLTTRLWERVHSVLELTRRQRMGHMDILGRVLRVHGEGS